MQSNVNLPESEGLLFRKTQDQEQEIQRLKKNLVLDINLFPNGESTGARVI